MLVLAIASTKGGVGKTTTVHTLGSVLARDRRVLLVDADPQASLTLACGIENAAGRSLAEVLGDLSSPRSSLQSVIQRVEENLFLVPAHRRLSGVEARLRGTENHERLLADALRSATAQRSWAKPFVDADARPFDVALIDTPPDFDLLTVCALAAADGVLVPVVPELLAFDSLRLFFDRLDRVRQSINPGLEVVGVLPTMCDKRLLHHRAILESMRMHGYPLLDVTIGRSIRVAESVTHAKSVVTSSPDNRRALEYAVLGMTVSGWLDQRASQGQSNFWRGRARASAGAVRPAI